MRAHLIPSCQVPRQKVKSKTAFTHFFFKDRAALEPSHTCEKVTGGKYGYRFRFHTLLSMDHSCFPRLWCRNVCIGFEMIRVMYCAELVTDLEESFLAVLGLTQRQTNSLNAPSQRQRKDNAPSQSLAHPAPFSDACQLSLQTNRATAGKRGRETLPASTKILLSLMHKLVRAAESPGYESGPAVLNELNLNC